MTYKTPEERAAYARKWRAANPERAKEIDNKKRAKQPPGAAAERTRKWRAANPEKARATAAAGWQKYYAENKEVLAERTRQWRAANPEKARESNARWHRENRANNPKKVRAMHLKSNYGITPEDYDRMLNEQDGHCAACSRTPDKEKHGVLHVDHDHATGVVRGLLCARCNTAFGLIAENLDGLSAYAKRHS